MTNHKRSNFPCFLTWSLLYRVYWEAVVLVGVARLFLLEYSQRNGGGSTGAEFTLADTTTSGWMMLLLWLVLGVPDSGLRFESSRFLSLLRTKRMLISVEPLLDTILKLFLSVPTQLKPFFSMDLSFLVSITSGVFFCVLGFGNVALLLWNTPPKVTVLFGIFLRFQSTLAQHFTDEKKIQRRLV